LLSWIALSLACSERITITDDNGSGKSTLIKAILGDESVYKTGDWHMIKRVDIGYLDQHYSTLDLFSNSEKQKPMAFFAYVRLSLTKKS
jgi:ATPase subunit of ABC transporter with duplicated ATPase domains